MSNSDDRIKLLTRKRGSIKAKTDLETLSEVPDEAFGEREQFEQLYYQLVAEARSLLKRSSLPALPPPAEEGSEAGSSAPHAMVKVTARDGSLRTARVLLDNGSTTNYVTQDLFSKLELDGRHVSSTVTGINGQTSFASECCDLVIESQSVKAVHLELVTDLSKEAFLAALARFTARRGKPRCIHADNSTTFVGGFNELNSFLSNNSDAIQSSMNEQGIDFKFIPPYSPHFGGLWESAVKSVKHHLRRTLGLAHLTYEEMTTCLIQIEAILNSRPLVPISSDPSDLSCLTPAHFLIGRPLLSVPHNVIDDNANISRLQRYQRVEALKQHFWRRFSNEYVCSLQQRSKWRSSRGQLQEGDLVLLKDASQPPLLWLMGRVTVIEPSSDGLARIVQVNTRKGLLRRAYQNLCLLPKN
ncbi:unnamed protein product [Plutella xylostella]|uniref:(diamondback moth) hypothetical protein n=1 Tax=Plutella xylostella TaxID=51655 RepID=A0A8S4GD30_PLUXY|nr:unnamed protein product [Plutella xylostella]